MIITWDDISELNKRLKENNFDYKVHLSDACGGQSMWIESLGGESNPQKIELLHVLIDDYFKALKAEVEFSWDKKSFWMKDRSLKFQDSSKKILIKKPHCESNVVFLYSKQSRIKQLFLNIFIDQPIGSCLA